MNTIANSFLLSWSLGSFILGLILYIFDGEGTSSVRPLTAATRVSFVQAFFAIFLYIAIHIK